MARVAKGLTFSLLAGLLAGCASDHTVGHVRVFNDTQQAVLISLCSSESCSAGGGFHHGSRVEPGGGGPVNVSTVGVPNVYLVQEPETGRRLGCLPLVMPHFVKGLVARVSSLIPCRHSYDEHIQWPPVGA